MDSAIIATPRWRVYLQLGRVSNLPTVWTNCIAATILAGVEPSGNLLPTLVGLSLIYTAGMFLNDAFDQNFDSQFRKDRPIPAGKIGAGMVFATGFGLLFAGEGIFLVGSMNGAGIGHTVAGLILCALVVYYDYRHKRDPLSPLIMALCRFMVYVVSATAVVSSLPHIVWLGGAILVAYLIGLTYIAKQENLRSVQRLWPLLFLAAPLIYGAPVLRMATASALTYLLLAAATLHALSLLRAGRLNVPRAVVTLIAGISLVDAVLIAAAGGPTFWVGVAASGFAATLLLQRLVSGT